MPAFGLWSASSATSLSAALCARPAEMRPIRRSALLLTDMLGDSLRPKLRLSPPARGLNFSTSHKGVTTSCAALQRGRKRHRLFR